jgi:protein-S-isoprenylcysteine O-methyltransferase Ste14
MQQTQQREAPERMSWARAMIFAVGFFFLAAILVAQLPSYINLEMTSSITALEQGALALAAVGIAGFIVIQVIVLLFDPKPLLPPAIFVGLGLLLALGGLALLLWAVFTNNQYFPQPGVTWNPLLGGQVLWLQSAAVDFLMIGFVVLAIGLAMMLYGGLALGELRNPDRSDPGTTLTIQMMLTIAIGLLALFAVFYTFVSDAGLASSIAKNPGNAQAVLESGYTALLLLLAIATAYLGIARARSPRPHSNTVTTVLYVVAALAVFLVVVYWLLRLFGVLDSAIASLATMVAQQSPATLQLVIDVILNSLLSIAVFLGLGAFALRLHYLMRPVRKRTMSGFYLVGISLAQVGVIFLLAWFLVYPALAWIHSWSFIGLSDYLTVCAKKSVVPGSCTFSQQAGYIVDAIITTNSFLLLMAAIWAWKGHRNLVVVSGVTITAVLAMATLLTHMHPDEILIAMLLSGGILTLAVVWTSVARREFAVVGEQNLGCLGQWLVVGTCLLIYLAAFAFFSVPGFRETETNVPFVPGAVIPAPSPPGQPPAPGIPSAMIMFLILGILAAIQLYFLVRNRYKV